MRSLYKLMILGVLLLVSGILQDFVYKYEINFLFVLIMLLMLGIGWYTKESKLEEELSK